MRKIFVSALLAVLCVAFFSVPSFAGYYQAKVSSAGSLPGVNNPCVVLRFGTRSTIATSMDYRWYVITSNDPNRDLATALTAQAGDLWVQVWIEDNLKGTNLAPVTAIHLVEEARVKP